MGLKNSGEEGCKAIFGILLVVVGVIFAILVALAFGQSGDFMGYVWVVFIIVAVIVVIYHGIKGK